MTDDRPPSPPSAPSAAGGHAGQAAPDAAGDHPPLYAFAWRHGLVRPTQGRLLAGVCAAVGRATNTDPVLWRVVIAVLSIFGGAGIVVYVVGWLLLPSEGDTATPVEALVGRGRSGTSAVVTVIAGLVVLFAIGGLIAGDPFRPGLLFAALLGGAILLLVRDRRGQFRTSGATPGSYTPFAPHGPFAPSAATVAHPATVTTPGQPPFPPAPPPPAPPFGPPLGPAGGPPGAFPAPKPPKPPRSRLGLLTFSLVLIFVGALALVDLATFSIPVSAYLAAGLATVGFGLVVGAWIGRARGLIALGILLAVALSVTAGVDRFGRWDGGNMRWAPASAELLEDSYNQDVGDAQLDLTDVEFSTVASTIEIDASVGLGNLEIIVPPNVDVTVDGKVGLGNASIFSHEWSGIDPDRQRVTDYGKDGPGGGKLSINARVDVGNLEVHR